MCHAIHRQDGEAGVRRILGVLSLAKKHGPAVVDEACAATLEIEVPTYRFVRRFLERKPALQLTLKQVDFTRMAILILNTDGFYDDLLSWARRAGRQGFLYGGLLYKVATTPTAAIRSLSRSLGR